MINKLKYVLISVSLIAISCNQNTKNTESVTLENTESAKISDMSIYNLPSHWTTQDGDDIELKDLQGKVLAMVMIYTSCQAACPRLVADMRNIEKQIPTNKKT